MSMTDTPWREDPLYGGMSDASARRSWEARQAKVVRQKPPEELTKGVIAFLDSMRHPGQDDPLDGPQEIIPGIISEGQTALFPGSPGTGKSFVIIDWLARVARNLDFLGQPVMQGGAVY